MQEYPLKRLFKLGRELFHLESHTPKIQKTLYSDRVTTYKIWQRDYLIHVEAKAL